MLSAFAFMRLASALGVGRLVDAIGERVVLATGIGIVAVSSALAGFAHSYLQLLLLRGAGGIGSAMFSVSAMGLLLRVVGPTQRGRSVGLFQGGFLLGGISGPAIGGPLAAWSIRAPFFVYAGTLVVAGTVAMVGLRRASLARKTETTSDADQARSRQPRRRLAPTRLSSRACREPRRQLGRDGCAQHTRPAVRRRVAASRHRVGRHRIHDRRVLSTPATLIPAGRSSTDSGRRPIMVGWLLAVGLARWRCSRCRRDSSATSSRWSIFGIGSGLLDVAPAAVVGDVAGKGGGTVVAAISDGRGRRFGERSDRRWLGGRHLVLRHRVLGHDRRARRCRGARRQIS